LEDLTHFTNLRETARQTRTSLCWKNSKRERRRKKKKHPHTIWVQAEKIYVSPTQKPTNTGYLPRETPKLSKNQIMGLGCPKSWAS